MKKTITLNKSQFHNLIKESVKRVLSESTSYEEFEIGETVVINDNELGDVVKILTKDMHGNDREYPQYVVHILSARPYNGGDTYHIGHNVGAFPWQMRRATSEDEKSFSINLTQFHPDNKNFAYGLPSTWGNHIER